MTAVLGSEFFFELEIQKRLDILARFENNGSPSPSVSSGSAKMARTPTVETLTALPAVSCGAKNECFVDEQIYLFWVGMMLTLGGLNSTMPSFKANKVKSRP